MKEEVEEEGGGGKNACTPRLSDFFFSISCLLRLLFSDIYADARDDPCAVVEYADEIYAYLRSAEGRDRPAANFLNKQKDINSGT